MKIISEEQIRALNVTSQELIKWVDQALRIKANAILPAKISMKPKEDVFCNVMPSIVGDIGGVKIVSRYPERTPTLDSKLILFDSITGEFKALLDSNYITTMRTAAVAVHSVKLLARKDFSVVGVIGLGEIGYATLKVFFDVFSNKNITLKIYDYKNRGREFVDKLNVSKAVQCVYCSSVQDVIRDSDVIISAPTYVKDDFCIDSDYKEGVLVVPIHTRGFTNCDLFFDKVFGDDYGHICHFKYFDKFKSFAETSAVLSGQKTGRESDKQRILAYNIGISLHDVFFGKKVLERLV